MGGGYADLCVRLEKLLDKVVHVIRDAHLVVVEAGAVGESRASWLVDVEQIGFSVPRVRVGYGITTISIYGAGPILAEECDLGRAARSAGHPHHNGICRWRRAALEEPAAGRARRCLAEEARAQARREAGAPVKVVLVAGRKLEIPRVLGDVVAYGGGCRLPVSIDQARSAKGSAIDVQIPQHSRDFLQDTARRREGGSIDCQKGQHWND